MSVGVKIFTANIIRNSSFNLNTEYRKVGLLKLNALMIVTMFLASAMILPVGMSYATYGGTMSGDQTTMNQTMTMQGNTTNTNETMVMNANATGSMSSTNATNATETAPIPTPTSVNSTAPQSNDTQSAQQVSDFIHTAVADFKQQGDATLKVMLDCRDRVQAAAPGDVDPIKKDCATQLNAITAQYQNERSHYHDLIKQYRSSVMVFLNDARGVSVDPATMASALTQLSGMMMNNSMSNGTMPGYAATMNNTHV